MPIAATMQALFLRRDSTASQKQQNELTFFAQHPALPLRQIAFSIKHNQADSIGELRV